MGLVEGIQELAQRHQRFVKRVHSFRIPLSPTGKRIASVVYFSIPVVGGYFIMQWAQSKARQELGYSDEVDGTNEHEANAVFGNMKLDSREPRVQRQNESFQAYLNSIIVRKG